MRRTGLLAAGLLTPGLLAAVTLTMTAATPPARAVLPANIELYSGFASILRGGQLHGRVHKGLPLKKPTVGQSRLRRVVQTIEALETRALPGASLKVEGTGLGAASQQVTADRNGFFSVWLPPGLAPGLMRVSVQLTDPAYSAATAVAQVPVWGPPAGRGLAIISDIDDTLTDSGVTHKLRLLKNTAMRSTWELKTFAGAPVAVEALAGKVAGGLPRRPVVYLSGSPWGLIDRIGSFFRRAGFPDGAMVLRRYSQEPLDAYRFKHPHLLKIVDTLVDRRFILLGDSGEKDPEVYRTLMNERPGRVAAVYIHLVTKEAPTSARFAGFRAFRSWVEMLDDARKKQLLPDGISGPPEGPGGGTAP